MISIIISIIIIRTAGWRWQGLACILSVHMIDGSAPMSGLVLLPFPPVIPTHASDSAMFLEVGLR